MSSLDSLPSGPPPHSNTSREKRARPVALARMTFGFSIIYDKMYIMKPIVLSKILKRTHLYYLAYRNTPFQYLAT